MTAVRSYTHVRQHLAEVMEEVCDGKAPIIVSRQNPRSVVMMSLEEFEALEATLHLLRSRRNAARLMRSIRQAEQGKLARDARPKR